VSTLIIYNKLVRDRIPEIIRNDNKECVTNILDDKTYAKELKKKFMEEMEEYQNAKNDEEAIEELADVMEIVRCLAKIHGSTIENVEKIRKEKAKKRGGFEDKIYLVGVKE